MDFEEIWRRNDPEGYEMVFGEKADENIESDDDENIDNDEDGLIDESRGYDKGTWEEDPYAGISDLTQFLEFYNLVRLWRLSWGPKLIQW